MSDPNTQSSTPEDLASALQACREVAEAEYAVADGALGAAESVARDAEARISELLTTLHEHGAHAEGLRETIERIAEDIATHIDELLLKTRRSLSIKRPRLGKFTVGLFGRTMAGKSTLRVAITGGNGATIGKGAQNTTRRTHQYEWRGLHIIDTPGFGAFKDKRYRQQATAVIEKSDVLLFLLREDGVHEEIFEGMKAVLGENKPVFFILNMMKNLEDDLYRRRFLADPNSFMCGRRVDGQKNRIHRLAVESLGTRAARVIAIHAQAAFLSTRPQFDGDRQALYRASHIGELHAALCHEVAVHGPVRRLQTLIDGTVGALQTLRDYYSAQSAKLGEEQAFFETKLGDFAHRSSAFQVDWRSRLVNGVAEIFAPLRAQIFNFIEENIEQKDIQNRWAHRVEAARIGERLKQLQEAAIAEARNLVEGFKHELSLDAELVSSVSVGEPLGWDGWDLRKGFGRGAAIAGVLSAVAFVAVELGAPNFWNPVGWVLFGVSAVAGFFAWLFGKKNDRLAKAKNEAREQLRKQIDEREADLREKLLAWFEKEICAKTVKNVSRDLAQLAKGLGGLSRTLAVAERASASAINKLNRRLIMRAANLNGVVGDESGVIRIARERGFCVRLLCDPRIDLKRLSKVASTALSEDVLAMPNQPLEEVVRQSLRPVRVHSVTDNGDQIEVRVGAKARAGLEGSGGRILRVTEMLIGKTIILATTNNT